MGVTCLVLGAICLVLFFTLAPHRALEVVGILLLIAGLLLLVVPGLTEDADAALASAVCVLGWRLP